MQLDHWQAFQICVSFISLPLLFRDLCSKVRAGDVAPNFYGDGLQEVPHICMAVEMKTSDPADPAQRCGDSESGNIGLTSSYKFASLGASHLQVTYK